MKMKVRKAVFPAAGLGTRFLPATKAQPKEMLPLVDALWVQGKVLQNQGNSGEAVTVLEESLEKARRLPYPYAEARILEQLGETGEALAIFRRLGAGKDIERLEHPAVQVSDPT